MPGREIQTREFQTRTVRRLKIVFLDYNGLTERDYQRHAAWGHAAGRQGGQHAGAAESEHGHSGEVPAFAAVHTAGAEVSSWQGIGGKINMAAPPAPDSLSLEQLLEAVDRLSPAKMREFERRMAARRSDRRNEGSDEATLARVASARLPAAAERRLKRLIARSERGSLTRDELTEYKALAQEVQRLDVARAEALAKLAGRRAGSVRAVKAEIGGEGGRDGT